MKVIGLTGIIGSGKSTVTAILRKKKFIIIDADKVGHRLLSERGPIRNTVLRTFGTTDRKTLGQIVFSDKKQLLKLNKIMHPAMKKEIAQEVGDLKKGKATGIIIEAAVFNDMKLLDLVDELWAVMANKAVIQKRLQAKYSPEELQKRLSKASSIARMRRYADHIITNNGSLQELLSKVTKLLME